MTKNCVCTNRIVIGRDISVVFLDFESHIKIKAKVDSGAYTGALHVEDIKEENGVLSFKPVSKRHKRVHVHDYRKKWVKPTTGEKHNRYVIKTKVRMANVERELELTLADRTEMKYDMLIGRKNLKGKFLVDVSK